MNKVNPVRKIIRVIFIVLGAIWLMFEEWVWDSILAIMERVGRLRAIMFLEAFLARQNPYLLLLLFVFPFMIMIPAKVYGLYLITSGKVLRGLTIFVLAKGLITALVTRLFIISKKKLLRIRAFSVFYVWFQDMKGWLYSELQRMSAWRKAKTLIRSLKRTLRFWESPRQ